MKYTHDRQLHGHALVFNGPLELVELAKRHIQDPGVPSVFRSIAPCKWPGRRATTWEELSKFLSTPWKEATDRVKKVQDYCKKVGLPEPKSVKRKGRWTDTDGEVDIDRAMRGDPDMFRQVRRERVKGPTNIALVTNLDHPGHVNPSGLYYRSTACIAVTDLLESLGYSVEVWMWCRGVRVYPNPDHNQFVACQMKKAGDPVDMDAMCDTLSAWFCSQAVFGSFAVSPEKPIGLGGGVHATEEDTLANTGIGKWVKYLDLQEGVLAVPVPMAWGSLESAAESATKTINRILAEQAI